MEIVKIEKVNLVEAVYQQLREMILSGKVPEGTKLESENKLAESFSVSRVVIREALQKLRGKKLIVTRQGVGTYVANPSNFALDMQSIELTEEAYLDFIHFREAVEYTAAALAKNVATEEDFDELDRHAAQLNQQLHENDDAAEIDFEFHLALVRCAHNVFLENAMKANRQLLVNVFKAMNGLPEAGKFTSVSHAELSRLMRNRDVKGIIRSYDEMAKYNIARLAKFFKNRM